MATAEKVSVDVVRAVLRDHQFGLTVWPFVNVPAEPRRYREACSCGWHAAAPADKPGTMENWLNHVADTLAVGS